MLAKSGARIPEPLASQWEKEGRLGEVLRSFDEYGALKTEFLRRTRRREDV